MLLQPKDYAVFRLTGELATDYSDASGTLLFDLLTRTWIDDFLVNLELAPDLLPRLHPSNRVVGTVTAQAAAATGLAGHARSHRRRRRLLCQRRRRRA